MMVSKEHLCHTLKAADISSVSTWFPSTHDLKCKQKIMYI
jgi:hypothetical protein